MIPETKSKTPEQLPYYITSFTNKLNLQKNEYEVSKKDLSLMKPN